MYNFGISIRHKDSLLNSILKGTFNPKVKYSIDQIVNSFYKRAKFQLETEVAKKILFLS